MSCLFYYKLVSDYPCDITKSCKLSINEVDSNFNQLKGDDISAATFVRDEDCKSASGTLVLTRNNGEQIIVPIDMNICKNLAYDFSATTEDNEKGVTLVLSYKDDDGEHELSIENVLTADNLIDIIGSDILTKVITDDTLKGLGTMKSPLGVVNTEKTGMLAPAIKVLDLTDGSELPSVTKKGTRYVTREYVNDYGYLYNGSGVEKISEILDNIYEEQEIYKEVSDREYYWHIPSKAEWDALLNSMELCENQNHDSEQCHVELGKLAGKYLKSECGWVNSEYECTCSGEKPYTGCMASDDTQTTDESSDMPKEKEESPIGVDKFGMKVLPSGVGKFVRGIGRYDGFRETTSFWTTTHVHGDIDQDVYVKTFDYDKSGVFQAAECPEPYYSVRLVKKFDGFNYRGVEYINGIPYNAILFPESGTIWLASNFADKKGFITEDNREENETPQLLKVNGGELHYEQKIELFINEYNGYYWEKKVLNDGDTIVIEYPCYEPTTGNTTTVCWYDSHGEEHCIEVEIPEVAQTNVEYRVYTEEDGCEKVLKNTDNLVVERILSLIVPMIEEERFERIEADEKLQDEIDEEVARAISAETALDEKIDAEIERAQEEEARLDSKIDAETERAQNAEEALDEKIDAETARAISAETVLDEKIDEEIARAIIAETALDEKIDEEIARAISAETALDEKIDAEIERAISAETALDEKIDEEIARAISAETALDEKIDAEIERATATEEEISGLTIDTSETYILSAATESGDNLVLKSKDGIDEHFIKIQFDGNFGEI